MLRKKRSAPSRREGHPASTTLKVHKVCGGLIFALFTVVREQFDSNSTPPSNALFMVDVKYPFKSASIPPIGEGWLLCCALKKWFECTIFPVIFPYLEIEKKEVRMEGRYGREHSPSGRGEVLVVEARL